MNLIKMKHSTSPKISHEFVCWKLRCSRRGTNMKSTYSWCKSKNVLPGSVSNIEGVTQHLLPCCRNDAERMMKAKGSQFVSQFRSRGQTPPAPLEPDSAGSVSHHHGCLWSQTGNDNWVGFPTHTHLLLPVRRDRISSHCFCEPKAGVSWGIPWVKWRHTVCLAKKDSLSPTGRNWM